MGDDIKMLLLKTKQMVVEYGRKILNQGLVVGTWGNISARDGDKGVFVITPSGMNYDMLEPEDIVEVDLYGKPITTNRKPSVETPMHAAIYRARPDVKAIIHVHSINASACAAAQVEIPCIMEDMASMVGGPVKVARYAISGSEELGQNAVEALADRNAVLLANHGVVAVGRDLSEAFRTCLIVEKSAEIFLKARILGNPVPLAESEVKFLREFFLNSYGQR